MVYVCVLFNIYVSALSAGAGAGCAAEVQTLRGMSREQSGRHQA